MKTKTRYAVTLEALPDDSRPPEIRLRQLLKIALRGLRLRCVTVQEVKPDQPAQVEVTP